MAAATGPMGEAVSLSTSKMAAADLAAIATYLKGLPEHTTTARPVAATDRSVVAGEAIYRDQCSACHALDGRGVPQLFPALAGSPLVHAENPLSLIRIVLRGARSVATPAEPTAPGMPSYAWQLTDQQVASVLTYIRNSWGSAAPAVDASDVAKARDELHQRPD
jgi:mono/diheme cytochrome c family protein